jgi:excisionase family DNA binding protein
VKDETLDIKGAAELLGVKPSTIRAWCLRRKLRYFKSGRAVRFRRTWLEQFIELNTTIERQDRPRA